MILFFYMDTDLKYPIALTMVKGVGPAIARKLITSLGDAKTVFEASRKELESIPNVGRIIASQIRKSDLLGRAERELLFLNKVGGRVLYFEDDAYPTRLKECEDHPIVLYQKGTMQMNVPRVIGVVGTRRMTPYGKDKVDSILEELGARFPDLLVVSGLAHGVDGCAHRRSVELGLQTVGVVGHGLDMIYPAEHRSLSEKMMANGGLLTEFHSHCVVDRKNFVSRNRIIAGMSDIVLVVESGIKGGALLTAEFANSYNRDVGAIPGRVNDLYSMGCNNLIKTNRATLIESATDILELMNWEEKKEDKPTMRKVSYENLTEKERMIVNRLEMNGNMQLNVLARELQLPMSDLSSLLFDMEMKDIVASSPGGMYGLK